LTSIQTALNTKTAITYYHLPSLYTISVAFPQMRMNEAAMLKRTRHLTLVGGEPAQPLLAPEDVALLTMERIRVREANLAFQGRREEADDIWNELLGLLKVQGSDLDLSYLVRQARHFGLLPVMQRALVDAGLVD
jgi:hypothetical protein